MCNIGSPEDMKSRLTPIQNQNTSTRHYETIIRIVSKRREKESEGHSI